MSSESNEHSELLNHLSSLQIQILRDNFQNISYISGFNHPHFTQSLGCFPRCFTGCFIGHITSACSRRKLRPRLQNLLPQRKKLKLGWLSDFLIIGPRGQTQGLVTFHHSRLLLCGQHFKTVLLVTPHVTVLHPNFQFLLLNTQCRRSLSIFSSHNHLSLGYFVSLISLSPRSVCKMRSGWQWEGNVSYTSNALIDGSNVLLAFLVIFVPTW